MAAHYDLDFVAFHCEQSGCREVFENSPNALSDADEVFCPRCGHSARLDGETAALMVAEAAAGRT